VRRLCIQVTIFDSNSTACVASLDSLTGGGCDISGKASADDMDVIRKLMTLMNDRRAAYPAEPPQPRKSAAAKPAKSGWADDDVEDDG